MRELIVIIKRDKLIPGPKNYKKDSDIAKTKLPTNSTIFILHWHATWVWLILL